MKPGNTQFDVRENTASSRQHAPRLVVRSIPAESFGPSTSSQNDAPSSRESSSQLPNHAAQIAATGEEAGENSRLLTVREVADLLKVPVSWVYERTRRKNGGQLPHLKLGKYLRFEESSLTEFIREQRRA
jgi:excisionase family DNA binding protein